MLQNFIPVHVSVARGMPVGIGEVHIPDILLVADEALSDFVILDVHVKDIGPS
jgi:hypothetical protein